MTWPDVALIWVLVMCAGGITSRIMRLRRGP